jgi:hypothetical protein
MNNKIKNESNQSPITWTQEPPAFGLNGLTINPGPALPATLSSAPLIPAAPAAAPNPTESVAVVDAKAVAPGAPARKIKRNGRIACLPRLQRDMVNRMLWNAVPYKNILIALDECGYTVTERNISNWATGGYLEWAHAQEYVLQNRLNQDQMLDFLRRDDAPEIPEVGMQAAATRISQALLQKLARADDPEAHLENYSNLVDLLCRLNRELSGAQKNRDDARRTLGQHYDPVLVKNVEQNEVIDTERFFSDPPAESKLSKPSAAPFLAPVPTDTDLTRQAAEDAHYAKLARIAEFTGKLKRIDQRLSKQTPVGTSSPRGAGSPDTRRDSISPSSPSNGEQVHPSTADQNLKPQEAVR